MNRTDPHKKGVILVGHGAAAKDCPRDLVMKLKALEAQRQRAGGEPSMEEKELDARIRNWPRTARNDPYKTGLESLADHLRAELNSTALAVAYNEFCSPSLEEAVEGMLSNGIQEISVIPSMMTPGGVHSEIEIPDILEKLRKHHPAAKIHYAWPFDLSRVAQLLTEHLDHRH
ncbi:MAG: CbiX/SirB N-terminal domain-containing protein [Nitrospirae bacterium]|nr:CbiX/SirB N-terminal domain-containing protein [Nitrospirota bacterium]